MATEELDENKRKENNLITIKKTIRQQPNIAKIAMLLIKKAATIRIINIIVPNSPKLEKRHKINKWFQWLVYPRIKEKTWQNRSIW